MIVPTNNIIPPAPFNQGIRKFAVIERGKSNTTPMANPIKIQTSFSLYFIIGVEVLDNIL